MIRPKIETEELLLSLSKIFETLITQTHRQAQKTLEIKLDKSRETFHFNPPIQIKEEWMLGLTSFDAYNSFFKITEGNNKFELYTDPPDNEFSFTKLKDKVFQFFHRGIRTQKNGPKNSKLIENYQLKSVRLMVIINYF